MHDPQQSEALIQAIRGNPWRSSVCLEQIPSEMKSMILWPEQKMLHWLAREYFTGSGAICDLGCFVGASTLSLAMGLQARKGLPAMPPQAWIHSYDLFLTPDDPYTLERLPEGYRHKDRFREVFDRNIRDFGKWIQVHDGDLRMDPWRGGDVEILFVDICKYWSTNQAVLENFFPYLIPGHSIVVQQDFVHVWMPWIPVTMAALADYFEVLTEEDSSRVYRLLRPVPEELLRKDFRHELSLEEKSGLLSSSIADSTGHTAAILTGALAMLVFMEGEAGEARRILTLAEREYAEDAAVLNDYRLLRETMDCWKDGKRYEQQMDEKF